jgi:hypothetical protein
MLDNLITTREAAMQLRVARERVVRALHRGLLDGQRDPTGRWWVTIASAERLKARWTPASDGWADE